MYASTPTESELEGTGFTPADYADDEHFEIWPENMQAVSVFCTIQTQWRTGMNGPTGLDYNVLFTRMDRLKLSEQDYEWMLDDIRVIEAAALTAMNKKD